MNNSKTKLYNKLNLSSKQKYFVIYTLLFAGISLLAFSWYFFAGRTFIWTKDGWSQNYKALIYYAKYLRSIVKNFITTHQFVLPQWDFSLGEGNDILQTMHYYAIGDPFAFFAIMIPTRFMWIYYDFSILLRLYLAGLAFSWLCFYTKKDIGVAAVLAGAMSYVFCFYAIINVNRHPYFLNPMLYFPLIILGVEKILNREKAIVFINAVLLSAISNFYYFYVIVLLTVIYVVARLLNKYKSNIKLMMHMLMKITGSAIVGTMMGGIILVPIIYAFANDARMGSGNAWHLLYPYTYYSSLVGVLFSGWNGRYWMCLGFSAPVIVAIFYLFIDKKRNSLLKTYFAIGVIISLIPALGQILNGMSYMSNRWCWAFALLCCYILSVEWHELMNIDYKAAIKIALSLGISFICILLLDRSRTIAAVVGVGIAFCFLLTIYPYNFKEETTNKVWKKNKQRIGLALVFAGVMGISFFENGIEPEYNAKASIEISKAKMELMSNEAFVVYNIAQEKGEKDFFRYSGRDLTLNGGTLLGLSSTNYYWSVSNPAIAKFMREMELIETKIHMHYGYDDRSALISLGAVKYYAVPDDDSYPMPYEYKLVNRYNATEANTQKALDNLYKEIGEEKVSQEQADIVQKSTEKIYSIYENCFYLPIAYTYDTVVNDVIWNNLSAIEKQEAMLQAAALKKYEGSMPDENLELTNKSMEYTVQCNSSGVSIEDYGFVVTSPKASVTFSFNGLENSETYFCIKGLDFEGISTYDLYFGDERYDPYNLYTRTGWNLLSYANQEDIRKKKLFWVKPTETNIQLQSSIGITKTINYYTEDYTWYNDRHDFSVNMDYITMPVTSITVTFSDIGIYAYDSIEIICQPMNNYQKQIEKLKENTLQDVIIATNKVEGSINIDAPKILCIAIPYSEGWTAYVDGEKRTLYQCNIKNMALELESGVHDIKLVYHTPYLREGLMISVVGILLYCGIFIVYKIERRRR